MKSKDVKIFVSYQYEYWQEHLLVHGFGRSVIDGEEPVDEVTMDLFNQTLNEYMTKASGKKVKCSILYYRKM